MISSVLLDHMAAVLRGSRDLDLDKEDKVVAVAAFDALGYLLELSEWWLPAAAAAVVHDRDWLSVVQASETSLLAFTNTGSLEDEANKLCKEPLSIF